MDQKVINVIKGLIMDATRKADSGHPGGAMSSADFAYILYREYLRFDPQDADWFNRDRFVLSCGHESMLLYSLLVLNGWLSLDEVKQFRQFGSKTPGHPEHNLTDGVEATTGPLGQGVAMSVGMAAAEMHMRATLGEDVCEHYTYVLASDGDMQEPVAFGAATLAGLWGLSKLIVYYDSNKVQLAGPTDRCDCTDYRKVYEGICWHVIDVDGHDHDQIRKAIEEAKASDKPTLIIGHTTMAKGTANCEGDFGTHGAPLSPEEIAATKNKLGLPTDETFHLPDDAVTHFRSRHPELAEAAAKWRKALEAKLASDDSFKTAWKWTNRDLADTSYDFPDFPAGEKIATRKAWGACLNSLIESLPTLVGGSADLDPSNQTVKFRETTGIFGADNPKGRNLPFGVREFPMAAILNGIALHGGLVPYGATFLTFSDYMRNAIRMSSLQMLPVLYVFTHDSFFLGEDGPTHQAIEHAASLRLIPNMMVMRPGDANETRACLEITLGLDDTPACLLLTRQGLPVLDPKRYPALAEGVKRGAYVIRDCEGEPEVVVIATGSELHLALEAAEKLAEKRVRVVSMPCMELFEAQPETYREEVLPRNGALYVAAEAGRPECWYKYVGRDGVILGINQFGHSAPNTVLAETYGFTTDNLVSLIRERL